MQGSEGALGRGSRLSAASLSLRGAVLRSLGYSRAEGSSASLSPFGPGTLHEDVRCLAGSPRTPTGNIDLLYKCFLDA